MEISKRTKELAGIFAQAIKENPNDAKATAMALRKLAKPTDFFEIIQGMEDPTSELAFVLAKYATAFHHGSSSENVPDEPITPEHIPMMAAQIKRYI